jgi:hypothetical protein
MPEIPRMSVPEFTPGRLLVIAIEKSDRLPEIMRASLIIQCINRVVGLNSDVDSAEDVLWAISDRILDKSKVIANCCVDEWWNHMKLGVDTTVDLDDIRPKRPTLFPFPGKRRKPGAAGVDHERR